MNPTSDTDNKFAWYKRPVLYKTKEEKASEKTQRKAEENTICL